MLQLEALHTRMQNAREQKVDRTLEDEDFQIIKKETNLKIEKIEKELDGLSDKHKDLKDLLATGLKRLSGLDVRYKKGTVKEQRVIISSMFPENLTFDGTEHRTHRINYAMLLIYQKNKELGGKKIGTNPFVSDLSQEVTP